MTQEGCLTDHAGSIVTVSYLPSFPPSFPPSVSTSPLPSQSPGVSFPLSVSLEALDSKRWFRIRFLLCLWSQRQINGNPPPHVSADSGYRKERTKLGSYLFISRSAEMFIGKQRGKVEWFDLISKSKCISSKTETILQLAVISCADDSGWQCRVTDVASWSWVRLGGHFYPREGTRLPGAPRTPAQLSASLSNS